MQAEITFKPSERSGLIAVGSYLEDAAKRLGVEMECEETEETEETKICVVKITEGADLLSPLTKVETEYLNEDQKSHGSRVADQARIEKEGVIVVMVNEKKKPEEKSEEEKAKQTRKEFEELPLEKKVAQLLELEMITIGETFSFILNSPYKIADKIMDVMAEFGLKKDDEAKKSKRPGEHQSAEEGKKKNAKSGKENSAQPAAETP